MCWLAVFCKRIHMGDGRRCNVLTGLAHSAAVSSSAPTEDLLRLRSLNPQLSRKNRKHQHVMAPVHSQWSTQTSSVLNYRRASSNLVTLRTVDSAIATATSQILCPMAKVELLNQAVQSHQCELAAFSSASRVGETWQQSNRTRGLSLRW